MKVQTGFKQFRIRFSCWLMLPQQWTFGRYIKDGKFLD